MATTVQAKAQPEAHEFSRFSSVQRAQHALLILSFTLLAVTGLPQKFAGDGWAEAIIAAFGGIELIRILHHYAAIVLVIVSIAEFIMLGYKIYVERARWTMFPRLQDVFDALNQTFYNLGLRREAPRYDRYSFAEKFEYWALVWGTLIMAGTGFILWNPIFATRILPGEFIPVAKAAHGGEAILAVLAILIWHFYNVHIKTLNKSMFTGKLTRHEMQEEHPLELELIEKGEASYLAPAEIQWRRRRRYMPLAVAAAALLMLVLYLFATTETTAISTIPPAEANQQVFVPRTFTPTATRVPSSTPQPPTATAGPPTATLEPGQPTFTPAPVEPTAAVSPTAAGVANAVALPADHAGRTVCQVCHVGGVGGAPKNPPDHAGRLDTSCTDCHKPKAAQ